MTQLHQSPEEYHPALLDARARYPLDHLAFYRPRTLTLPDGDVSCATLADLVVFVLSGDADKVTLIEQSEFILATVAKTQEDPYRVYAKDAAGRLVFDAPNQSGAGSIVRAPRTDAQKYELLADSRLPADIRHQYERELGLPITPVPLHPFYAFQLPHVLGADGEPIAEPLVTVLQQDEKGTTTLQYNGVVALTEFSVVTGLGQMLPLLPNYSLSPGATITVPLSVGRALSMTAAGVVFRDGKVARDVAPTPAEAESDAQLEGLLYAEVRAGIAALMTAGATLESMVQLAVSKSFRRLTAIAIVREVLQSNGQQLETYAG